jgi:hypothetical protein
MGPPTGLDRSQPDTPASAPLFISARRLCPVAHYWSPRPIAARTVVMACSTWGSGRSRRGPSSSRLDRPWTADQAANSAPWRRCGVRAPTSTSSSSRARRIRYGLMVCSASVGSVRDAWRRGWSAGWCRAAERGAEPARFGAGEVDVGPPDRFESRAGTGDRAARRDARRAFDHQQTELGHAPLGDGGEQVLLVGEVPVHSIVRDTGLPGGRPQQDRVGATGAGQVDPGFDECLA